MKISDCKIESFSYDFLSKRTKFELSVLGNLTQELESLSLNGDKYNVDIKKESKRTNNANGYAWVLLGELQDKLKIPKEEIYRKYIRECGVYEVIPIRNDALAKFTDSWSRNGLGWVCDTTESKVKGYTNVIAYYGTSVYSKAEMAMLLDSIVQDCIEQGIPTKKREDLENLLESWE